ncbi:MAG TPA: prepilin peptidase [Candidatus Limnocylindrales bacterium]|nr:prepilin peptidase [Candidatus Limnocylindrales bacterium]
MVILTLIVFGLCLGSFVNALVWRLYKQMELEEAGPVKKVAHKQKLSHEELSIAKGRSMCSHCHHPLAAKDLVPVLSYLSLGGTCRYCRKPIADTPSAELLTPLLFVVSYVAWPYGLTDKGLVLFIFWLVFLVGFVALTIYDFKWYLLPDKIVFPLIGLAVLQVLVVAVLYGGGLPTVIHAVLGVAVGSGLFYVLFQVSDGRWIGGGDVKLGIVLGLLAGSASKAFLVIFIASLLGTLIAVPLLAVGKASRTSHLPFGPFLLAGLFVTVLFGDRLVGWYLRLFLG